MLRSSGKIFYLNLKTDARLDRQPTASDAHAARPTSPSTSPHVRFTSSTVTSPVSQYPPEKDKSLLEGQDMDAFGFGNRRAVSQPPMPSRSSMKTSLSRPLSVPVDIPSPSSPSAPTSPFSPFDFDVANVARRLEARSSTVPEATTGSRDFPSRTSSMSPPRRDVGPYAELQAQLKEARRREAQLRIELDRARLDQAHERIAHLEYRLDIQARELEDCRYGGDRAFRVPSTTDHGAVEDGGPYEASYANAWMPASYHGHTLHAAQLQET